MTTTCHHFPGNPGYLLHRCTEQELEPIWREVNLIEQSRGQGWPGAQQDLVGVIDREFHLTQCRPQVFDLVKPLAERYIDYFGYGDKINHHVSRTNRSAQSFELGNLWVNFQQPGEYNPVHEHGGVFSFVIWLRIPYRLKDEQSQGQGLRPGYKPNGDFHFHFTDTLGAIRTHFMEIDQDLNGTLCLFPAELHHVVYPYTTTRETRISLSGNLHLAL